MPGLTSFRELIDALERSGVLRSISRAVDPRYELIAVMRAVQKAGNEPLLFTNAYDGLGGPDHGNDRRHDRGVCDTPGRRSCGLLGDDDSVRLERRGGAGVSSWQYRHDQA
ncbi:MAG: UbiD family decarboxylase [Xanthobacteraceae bacterium]|nr:UbiD family decarboxylase [Xanthobacteraceae bacterium]